MEGNTMKNVCNFNVSMTIWEIPIIYQKEKSTGSTSNFTCSLIMTMTIVITNIFTSLDEYLYFEMQKNLIEFNLIDLVTLPLLHF